MHPSVRPLAAILRLDTELLLNCIEGMTEEQALQRVGPGVNNVAFLTAHLVESRHFLAERIGAPLPAAITASLATARSVDHAGVLPSLAALREAWERISAHLAVHVERLDTAQLNQPSQPFPGSDGTVLGACAFLAQHEAHHIGQLALLRRQVGLPAMSYVVSPREPGRAGA